MMGNRVGVIIGNGFDLNLGLKTGYSDFMKSAWFEDNIDNGNELCIYLKEQRTLKNWIDIENELKNYSLKDGVIAPVFHSDLKVLSKSLMGYLANIDYKTIKKSSKAYSFIQNILMNEVKFFDFNYTNSIQYVMNDMGFNNVNNVDIIKMHGSINDGQIVFGVEDNAHIGDEFVFVKKTFSKHFKSINLVRVMNEMDVLIFFGHSLGITDHMYFDDFFHKRSIEISGQKEMKMGLYYYGDEGYLAMMQQLNRLTDNRVSKLRQLNNIELIDLNESV